MAKPLGTAGMVVLGPVAGAMLAAYAQQPAGWGAAAGAVLGYLVACARYPWKLCPRCGGGSTDRDAERNYRVRRTCWLCGGDRWPRAGTRLLRVFGFSPRE